MAGFQNDPGTVQQESGFGFNGRFWTESFHNLVASTTHTQAGATLIDSMFNTVTVNNPGDSVVLPSVAVFPGGALIICVQNISVNPMQVFAQGSDTINGMSGVGGVSQMQNSIAYYQCTQAGVWQVTGLGFGFATGNSASFETLSTQTGITASSTQTAAAGTLITAAQAQISTCAVSGNAVTLPPAKPGMQITLVNNGAQPAGVFGATQTQGGQAGGDTIAGSLTAFSLAVTTPVIFYCFVAGNWVTK